MTDTDRGLWRGRHDLNRVLRVQNFLPVLPVMFVTSTLTNANLQSLNSLLSWIATNLFAFGVLGALIILLGRLATRHQFAYSVSAKSLIALGLLLGFLKAFLTEMPIHLIENRLDSSSLIDIGLNPGILVGPAVLIVTALYIKGKDTYSAERDLLIAQKIASIESGSAKDSFSSQILREIVTKATEKLGELRARLKGEFDQTALSQQAHEIRTLVELTIRPLSHKIWNSQSESYAEYNTRELTRIWIVSGDRQPLLFSLTIAPGIASWLLANGSANLLLPSLALIMVVNSLIQVISKSFGRLAAPLAVIRLIATEFSSVLATWSIMSWQVDASPQEAVAVLISVAVFLPTFSWLIGLFSAGYSIRGEVRAELENLIGLELMSNLVEKATLRLQTKQLAQTLHSQVQNDLIATALRLEKGFIREVDELDQQLAEIADSLNGTVMQTVTFAGKSISESLTEAAEAWQGFMSVEIHVIGDLSIWEGSRQHLIQAVNEALSNAYKHGGANHVEIRMVAKASLEITITDNGKPKPGAKPGLGFALFSHLSNGDFHFSTSGQETQVFLRVPRGG